MNDSSHYTVIDEIPEPVTAKVGNSILASGKKVLELKEHYNGKEYPPIIYFPGDAVAMEFLDKVENYSTRCPIKGDASYYDLKLNGKTIEKAAWSYEDPLPANKQIKGHISFDMNKLDLNLSRQ